MDRVMTIAQIRRSAEARHTAFQHIESLVRREAVNYGISLAGEQAAVDAVWQGFTRPEVRPGHAHIAAQRVLRRHRHERRLRAWRHRCRRAWDGLRRGAAALWPRTAAAERRRAEALAATIRATTSEC